MKQSRAASWPNRPIIPTNYIPTQDQQSADVIIQNDQPTPNRQTGAGDSIQVKHLNVLDPSLGAEWDALVAKHPASSVFHTSAWARVVCETYNHKPYYLCFLSGNEPVALVPIIEVLSPLTGRRGVCLPFSDACGPLAFGAYATLEMRRQIAILTGERCWKYFEVREPMTGSSIENSANEYYGHSLQLDRDPDVIFQDFTGANRRAIQRARHAALKIDFLTTEAATREFYNLHIRTRRRHGVPPQPWKFFAALHQHLLKQALGFIALARLEGRAVAGAVFLRFGRKAVYKFAASDPEFGRTRANNLVIWEAIQHLVRSGCELLDFGRTSQQNHGLRRFKLSWAAKERMIQYYRFDAIRDTRLRGSRREHGFHTRIFRNLPLMANRLAGAMLYPHLD